MYTRERTEKYRLVRGKNGAENKEDRKVKHTTNLSITKNQEADEMMELRRTEDGNYEIVLRLYAERDHIMSYAGFEEVARAEGCILPDGTGDIARYVFDLVSKYVGSQQIILHADEIRETDRLEEERYQERIDEARARGDEERARCLEKLRGDFCEG